MGRQRALVIALLLLSSFANDALAWWWSSDVSEQQQRLDNVTSGLKKAYKEKLQPVEEMFLFERFNSFMTIDDSDFDAKPIILLLGQYSTGKTTFIRYLLKDSFPGIEVGPEPTTDSFMAVMYGDQRQVTPGSVLALDKTKHFKGLRQFGSEFLQHFKASTLPNPVLKSITLVDTPGILSGKRQVTDRGYDFARITSWFAERADMIILFFDVHKLDVLEEFQNVINLILKHHKKMLVVLNKADTITTPELIRVYGGLMWALGRIINTPEVTRVYIGSFWDKGYSDHEGRTLFDNHRDQLFTKIQDISRLDVMVKVGKMIQRANQVKAHALILCYLRSQMPWFSILRQQRQLELINNLDEEIKKIQAKSEDKLEFPDVKEMQEHLQKYNLMDFPTCDEAKGQLDALESMFSKDLGEIAKLLTEEGANEGKKIKDGAFKHSEL